MECCCWHIQMRSKLWCTNNSYDKSFHFSRFLEQDECQCSKGIICLQDNNWDDENLSNWIEMYQCLHSWQITHRQLWHILALFGNLKKKPIKSMVIVQHQSCLQQLNIVYMFPSFSLKTWWMESLVFPQQILMNVNEWCALQSRVTDSIFQWQCHEC